MATDATQDDLRTLLELAVDVHTDLSKLAVGLAHAGAQPQAVQTLQHMAGVVGELAKLLGAGPVGSVSQGGAEAPGEASGAPAPEAAAPPAQAPSGPPQGPTPGARPNGFHEASAQLQAALASKHAAAQRALAGNQ